MRELTLEHDVVIDLAQGLLAQGTGVWLKVTGNSMSPLIRSGDQVLMEPISNSKTQIEEGIILAYRGAYNALVIHRVVKVASVGGGGRKLLLRGDGLGAGQEWVGLNSVVGVVRRSKRGGVVVRLDSLSLFVWTRLAGVGERCRSSILNRLCDG